MNPTTRWAVSPSSQAGIGNPRALGAPALATRTFSLPMHFTVSLIACSTARRSLTCIATPPTLGSTAWAQPCRQAAVSVQDGSTVKLPAVTSSSSPHRPLPPPNNHTYVALECDGLPAHAHDPLRHPLQFIIVANVCFNSQEEQAKGVVDWHSTARTVKAKAAACPNATPVRATSAP